MTKKERAAARRARRPKKRPKTLPPAAIPSDRHLSAYLRGVTSHSTSLVRHRLSDVVRMYAAQRADGRFDSISSILAALIAALAPLKKFKVPARALLLSSLGEAARANVRAANEQVKDLGFGAPFSVGEVDRTVIARMTEIYAPKVQALPERMHERLKDRLGPMFERGAEPETISAAAEEEYAIADRGAKSLSRDAISQTNADLTQARMEDLGIQTYKWVASRDERVRKLHRELDGTMQRYDDPPVADERTGRRANPGIVYGCRCTAVATVDDVIAALEGP